MALLARIRAYVRKLAASWLGLDELPSSVMFKAMEVTARERNNTVMQGLMALDEKLTRIETRLIAQNLQQNQPQITFNTPVYDWDTVQAIALHELEKDSKKEN